ncbi:DNA repair protein xrcc3 [Saguinus oedipus]|uniref:DNA repair protein xrcc3 n=1 Tax=Saguinus oedipus TaxID=9490 RepID=A0ABQ9V630_SAGOE|nr:DNA repair protein xrcc3 [Saguinus oedipus]
MYVVATGRLEPPRHIRHSGFPGAVYICTEDAFPHKRLQQLMAHQPRLRTDVPEELLQKLRSGSQIFIEHAADVETGERLGPIPEAGAAVP